MSLRNTVCPITISKTPQHVVQACGEKGKEGGNGGGGGGGLSDFIKGNNSRILWFLYIIDGGSSVRETGENKGSFIFSVSLFVCFLCVFLLLLFLLLCFLFLFFWLIFVCFSDVNFPGDV